MPLDSIRLEKQGQYLELAFTACKTLISSNEVKLFLTSLCIIYAISEVTSIARYSSYT